MSKFNDPSKPGYTSVPIEKRPIVWESFFKECVKDGSCFVSKTLIKRDGNIVEKAAKRMGFKIANNKGDNFWFKLDIKC